MLSRFPLVVFTLLLVFVAGFASSRFLERNAHAQTAPFASTVYVPADGLAFRTFEGRVIARLSYDRRGGTFDLYDGDEHPSSTVREGALLAAPPPPRGPTSSAKANAIDLGF